MKATKVIRHTAANIECVNCKERLGGTVLQVDVPEDNGEGGGKNESWCPQCFVGIRALRDARWIEAVRIGQIMAVKCGGCGKTSVDFGRRCCGQCGSKKLVQLLPKNIVVSMKALTRAVGARVAAGGRRRFAVGGVLSS